MALFSTKDFEKILGQTAYVGEDTLTEKQKASRKIYPAVPTQAVETSPVPVSPATQAYQQALQQKTAKQQATDKLNVGNVQTPVPTDRYAQSFNPINKGNGLIVSNTPQEQPIENKANITPISNEQLQQALGGDYEAFAHQGVSQQDNANPLDAFLANVALGVKNTGRNVATFVDSAKGATDREKAVQDLISYNEYGGIEDDIYKTNSQIDKLDNSFSGEYGANLKARAEERNRKTEAEQQALADKYGMIKAYNIIAQGGQGVGALIPSIIANYATAGTLGSYVFSANVYGGAFTEAVGNEATYSQAKAYATMDTALETAAEYLFAGIAGLTEGSITGRLLGEDGWKVLADKFAKTQTGRYIIRKAYDVTGEGIEEIVSEIVTPFLKRMTYDREAPMATLSEIAQAFGGGALVSALLGVSSIASEYRDSAKTSTELQRGSIAGDAQDAQEFFSDCNNMQEAKKKLYEYAKQYADVIAGDVTGARKAEYQRIVNGYNAVKMQHNQAKAVVNTEQQTMAQQETQTPVEMTEQEQAIVDSGEKISMADFEKMLKPTYEDVQGVTPFDNMGEAVNFADFEKGAIEKSKAYEKNNPIDIKNSALVKNERLPVNERPTYYTDSFKDFLKTTSKTAELSLTSKGERNLSKAYNIEKQLENAKSISFENVAGDTRMTISYNNGRNYKMNVNKYEKQYAEYLMNKNKPAETKPVAQPKAEPKKVDNRQKKPVVSKIEQDRVAILESDKTNSDKIAELQKLKDRSRSKANKELIDKDIKKLLERNKEKSKAIPDNIKTDIKEALDNQPTNLGEGIYSIRVGTLDNGEYVYEVAKDNGRTYLANISPTFRNGVEVSGGKQFTTIKQGALEDYKTRDNNRVVDISTYNPLLTEAKQETTTPVETKATNEVEEFENALLKDDIENAKRTDYNKNNTTSEVKNNAERADLQRERQDRQNISNEQISIRERTGNSRETKTNDFGQRVLKRTGGTVSIRDNRGNKISEHNRKLLEDTAIKNGKREPIVVYHYTDNMSFKEFGEGGVGFHFATNVETSLKIKSNDNKQNGRVIKAYLNIKNPLKLSSDYYGDTAQIFSIHLFDDGVLSEEQQRNILDLALEDGGRYGSKSQQLLSKYLGELGYDGMMYVNDVEGTDFNFIALYPEQVVIFDDGMNSFSNDEYVGGDTNLPRVTYDDIVDIIEGELDEQGNTSKEVKIPDSLTKAQREYINKINYTLSDVKVNKDGSVNVTIANEEFRNLTGHDAHTFVLGKDGKVINELYEINGKKYDKNKLAEKNAKTEAKIKAKEEAKITDVGEKIGGARKDMWLQRGLGVEDLQNMTEIEQKKYGTKSNVWKKPTAELEAKVLSNEMPRDVAVFIDELYTKLPQNAPRGKEFYYTYNDAPVSIRDFVDCVSAIRDYVGKIKTSEQLKEAVTNKKMLEDLGYVNADASTGYYSIRYTDKGKKVAGVLTKISDLLRDVERDSYSWNGTLKKSNIGVAEAEKMPKGYWIEEMVSGKFEVRKKYDKYSTLRLFTADTKEEALKWVKENVVDKKASKTEKKTALKPKYLERVERRGIDHRKGKNVTVNDFADHFGFRAIEFGNWENQTERQQNINYAFDALCDMADVLGISYNDVSLNGKLALAFGSRGKGTALAHYEPMRVVINLTKMKGAGSLAHEWWHALDNMVALKDVGKGASTTLKMATRYNEEKDVNKIDVGKERVIRKDFSKLVEAMKFRMQTQEEAETERLSSIKTSNETIKSEFEKYIPAPSELTDAQQKKVESVLNKLLKEDTTYESIKSELAELYKEVVPSNKLGVADYSRKYTIPNLINARERLVKTKRTPRQVPTTFYSDAMKIDSNYSKSDNGYWASTVEMSARAFADYVDNRLADNDMQNDYLSAHAKGLPTLDKNTNKLIYTYPYDVRDVEAISTAFDNLLAGLKKEGFFTEEKHDISGKKVSYNEETDAEKATDITLNAEIPVVTPFIKHSVTPVAEDGIEFGKNLVREANKIFNPTKNAPVEFVNEFFAYKGRREKTIYQLQEQVKADTKVFNEYSAEDNIEFIRRLQKGEKQKTTELDRIAKRYREMFDGLATEIKKYNPTIELRENYFPNMWSNSKKEIDNAMNSLGFKRGMRGDKSFLKKRVYETIADGIEADLTPITTNPAKMFEYAITNETKYVTATGLMKSLKDEGYVKYIKEFEAVPDGYVRIDDSIARVYYRTEAGMGKIGEYYAHESVGQTLHNWLMPNAITENVIGRELVKGKNFLTRLELAVSGFHYVQTAMTAIQKQVSFDVMDAVNRKMYDRLWQIPIAPYNAVKQVNEGLKYMEFGANEHDFRANPANAEWLKKHPNASQMFDLFFEGGGKLATPEYMKDGFIRTAKDCVKQGDFVAGAYKGAFEISDKLVKPLFDKGIPALKMAGFAKGMEHDLAVYAEEIANGDITVEELARQNIDHMDDLYGAMNYDNRNWNKTVKQALQVIYRSPTWWYGNVHMFYGIGKENATNVKNVVNGAKNGAKPKVMLGRNTSFALGLALVTAFAGAIMHTVMNNELPEDIKDVFFPRTGAKKRNGEDERVVPSGYFRSWYNMIDNPTGSLAGAQSGMFDFITRLMYNEDFYGNYIYTPHASKLQNAEEIAKYFGSELLVPFTISNAIEAVKNNDGKSFAMSFFGINGAPNSVEDTKFGKAVSEAYEMYGSTGGKMTPEEAEDNKIKSEWKKKIYYGQATTSEIQNAIKKGELTSTSASNAKLNSTQKMWKYINSSDAKNNCWKLANADEKTAISQVEIAKEPNSQTKAFVDDWKSGKVKVYGEEVYSQIKVYKNRSFDDVRYALYYHSQYTTAVEKSIYDEKSLASTYNTRQKLVSAGYDSYTACMIYQQIKNIEGTKGDNGKTIPKSRTANREKKLISLGYTRSEAKKIVSLYEAKG